MLKFTRYICVASLCVALHYSGILPSLAIVSGESMSPTMASGQAVLYTRSAKPYTKGRIYIVDLGGGCLMTKRLIGCPDDVVLVSGGNVYVNGDVIVHGGADDGREHLWRCGDDEYIFLGDNLDNSVDSRSWVHPYVASSQIIGRVIL